MYKVKSRAIHYALEEEEELQLSEYFWEDETLGFHWSSIDVELDALEIFIHDGPHEEVDSINFILKDNPIQEGEEGEEEKEEEVKKEEEVEEEEESEEESEGYQTSEEIDE